MAFLIKSMIGNPLSGIGLGGGGDKEEEATPSDPAKAAGMTREEYEEYQKQVVEEKMERDADFLHKKAERATLRVCLREKYRLPKSEQDENMIEMAGDDVDVPEELLKMVDEDATEEEGKDSLMGQIQNLQNMDMDQLKEKASATVTELKTKAEEKCAVM
ncbi:complexin-4a [Syngnathus acus]|uniref:complexin-4a n=1 Tax=Syngnathus acus TaxID=161584 RepID=UPI001885E650|nr:complexin-4a [Syngnathus acus]XP_049594839.1 complexin-4a [Syngnathus scovelli]